MSTLSAPVSKLLNIMYKIAWYFNIYINRSFFKIIFSVADNLFDDVMTKSISTMTITSMLVSDGYLWVGCSMGAMLVFHIPQTNLPLITGRPCLAGMGHRDQGVLVAVGTKPHLPPSGCIEQFLSFHKEWHTSMACQLLSPQTDANVGLGSIGLSPLAKDGKAKRANGSDDGTSSATKSSVAVDYDTTSTSTLTARFSIDDATGTSKSGSLEPGPLSVVYCAPPDEGGYDDPTELLKHYPIGAPNVTRPDNKDPDAPTYGEEMAKKIVQIQQEQTYVNLSDDIIGIEQYGEDQSPNEPTYANTNASLVSDEPTYANTDTNLMPDEPTYANTDVVNAASQEMPDYANAETIVQAAQPTGYEVPVTTSKRRQAYNTKRDSNIIISVERYEPKSLKSTDKLYEHIPADTITMTMPGQTKPKEKGSLFVLTGGCGLIAFHRREESSVTHDVDCAPCVIAYQVPDLA